MLLWDCRSQAAVKPLGCGDVRQPYLSPQDLGGTERDFSKMNPHAQKSVAEPKARRRKAVKGS